MTGKPCVGYTLLCYAGSDRNPTLIDMLGRVVHEWPISGSSGVMLPGGSLLGSKRPRGAVDPNVPLGPPPPPPRPASGGRRQGPPPNPLAQDTVEFVQVSWDGTEEWSFSGWDDDGTGTMMSRQHHGSQREGNPVGYYAPGANYVDKGRTLILAHKNVNVPRISDLEVVDDVVYEVSWDGTLTGFVWLCSDHFDQIGFDESAKQVLRTGPHADARPACFDWVHLNAVTMLGKNRWYDEEHDERFHPENFMICARTANFIAIVSRATGDIVWKAGPDFIEGTPEHALGQFVGQHHAHIIPAGLPGEGNVLVFDNGGQSGFGGSGRFPRYTRDYSRVIEFNPITFEMVWEYRQETGKNKFFSHFISSAQRLPNGNTLIDEGAKGRVFEVTRAKETVWEYIAPKNDADRNDVYRAFRIAPEWVPDNPAGYTEWRHLYK